MYCALFISSCSSLSPINTGAPFLLSLLISLQYHVCEPCSLFLCFPDNEKAFCTWILPVVPLFYFWLGRTFTSRVVNNVIKGYETNSSLTHLTDNLDFLKEENQLFRTIVCHNKRIMFFQLRVFQGTNTPSTTHTAQCIHMEPSDGFSERIYSCDSVNRSTGTLNQSCKSECLLSSLTNLLRGATNARHFTILLRLRSAQAGHFKGIYLVLASSTARRI